MLLLLLLSLLLLLLGYIDKNAKEALSELLAPEEDEEADGPVVPKLQAFSFIIISVINITILLLPIIVIICVITITITIIIIIIIIIMLVTITIIITVIYQAFSKGQGDKVTSAALLRTYLTASFA